MKPYVMLNWGEQETYPAVRITVPRPEDVSALTRNVKMLMPYGLRVREAEMRTKLGLSEPERGDAVLEMPESGTAPNATDPNASIPAAADDLAGLIDAEQWEPLLKPFHDALEQAIAQAESYDDLRKRLPALLAQLDDSDVNQRLAIAQTLARGLGDRDYRSEE